jgi:hypothetical protein
VCSEVQRDEAVAAQRAAEAAAREVEVVEEHREWSRERDLLACADVLESDWVRKSLCVEQEEAWHCVWQEVEEERVRKEAAFLAACKDHLLARVEREMAARESSLEVESLKNQLLIKLSI